MRLWPAVLLILLFWAVFVANRLIDTTITSHFFTSVLVPLVIYLLFLIWWLTGRGIRLADRFIGVAAVVAGELGKFQAIKGKTWNHPVIAHGRLYLRNDQEMACYQLTPDVAAQVTKQ